MKTRAHVVEDRKTDQPGRDDNRQHGEGLDAATAHHAVVNLHHVEGHHQVKRINE
jgi:hypothetical protein